jgi:hypothetical protein
VSRVLFIQAESRLLNPSLDSGLIDAAYADDAEAARSEWGGLFRSDISEYLPDALIDAAVVPGRVELPWALPLRNCYVAFCDPSGGAHDAMTMAIAHREPGRREECCVLDQIHVAAAPFEPEEIARRFSAVLQRFEIHHLIGDRYAAEWVVSAFRRAGMRYEASPIDKSQIYNEVLPLFSQKRVELLDDKRLLTELRLLERRPRSGGRGDSIDHPRAGRDDIANAACGALWQASISKSFLGMGGTRSRPPYALMVSSSDPTRRANYVRRKDDCDTGT